MTLRKDFKFTILTPWVLLPETLPEDVCTDEAAEEFATYLCLRTREELNRYSFWPRERGEAFLFTAFDTFEERFLKNSEYAVIVISGRHACLLDHVYPRLLVFLTMRPTWTKRILLVFIGSPTEPYHFCTGLLKHPPIIFDGNSIEDWNESVDEWAKLLGVLKHDYMQCSEDDLPKIRPSRISEPKNDKWMSVTDLRGKPLAVKVTESRQNSFAASWHVLTNKSAYDSELTNQQKNRNPNENTIGSLPLDQSNFPNNTGENQSTCSLRDHTTAKHFEGRSVSLSPAVTRKPKTPRLFSNSLSADLSLYNSQKFYRRRENISNRIDEQAEYREQTPRTFYLNVGPDEMCLRNGHMSCLNYHRMNEGPSKSPKFSHRRRSQKSCCVDLCDETHKIKRRPFRKLKSKTTDRISSQLSKEKFGKHSRDTLGNTLRSLATVSTEIISANPTTSERSTSRNLDDREQKRSKSTNESTRSTTQYDPDYMNYLTPIRLDSGVGSVSRSLSECGADPEEIFSLSDTINSRKANDRGNVNAVNRGLSPEEITDSSQQIYRHKVHLIKSEELHATSNTSSQINIVVSKTRNVIDAVLSEQDRPEYSEFDSSNANMETLLENTQYNDSIMGSGKLANESVLTTDNTELATQNVTSHNSNIEHIEIQDELKLQHANPNKAYELNSDAYNKTFATEVLYELSAKNQNPTDGPSSLIEREKPHIDKRSNVPLRTAMDANVEGDLLENISHHIEEKVEAGENIVSHLDQDRVSSNESEYNLILNEQKPKAALQWNSTPDISLANLPHNDVQNHGTEINRSPLVKSNSDSSDPGKNGFTDIPEECLSGNSEKQTMHCYSKTDSSTLHSDFGNITGTIEKKPQGDINGNILQKDNQIENSEEAYIGNQEAQIKKSCIQADEKNMTSTTFEQISFSHETTTKDFVSVAEKLVNTVIEESILELREKKFDEMVIPETCSLLPLSAEIDVQSVEYKCGKKFQTMKNGSEDTNDIANKIVPDGKIVSKMIPDENDKLIENKLQDSKQNIIKDFSASNELSNLSHGNIPTLIIASDNNLIEPAHANLNVAEITTNKIISLESIAPENVKNSKEDRTCIQVMNHDTLPTYQICETKRANESASHAIGLSKNDPVNEVNENVTEGESHSQNLLGTDVSQVKSDDIRTAQTQNDAKTNDAYDLLAGNVSVEDLKNEPMSYFRTDFQDQSGKIDNNIIGDDIETKTNSGSAQQELEHFSKPILESIKNGCSSDATINETPEISHERIDQPSGLNRFGNNDTQENLKQPVSPLAPEYNRENIAQNQVSEALTTVSIPNHETEFTDGLNVFHGGQNLPDTKQPDIEFLNTTKLLQMDMLGKNNTNELPSKFPYGSLDFNSDEVVISSPENSSKFHTIDPDSDNFEKIEPVEEDSVRIDDKQLVVDIKIPEHPINNERPKDAFREQNKLEECSRIVDNLCDHLPTVLEHTSEILPDQQNNVSFDSEIKFVSQTYPENLPNDIIPVEQDHALRAERVMDDESIPSKNLQDKNEPEIDDEKCNDVELDKSAIVSISKDNVVTNVNTDSNNELHECQLSFEKENKILSQNVPGVNTENSICLNEEQRYVAHSKPQIIQTVKTYDDLEDKERLPGTTDGSLYSTKEKTFDKEAVDCNSHSNNNVMFLKSSENLENTFPVVQSYNVETLVDNKSTIPVDSIFNDIKPLPQDTEERIHEKGGNLTNMYSGLAHDNLANLQANLIQGLSFDHTIQAQPSTESLTITPMEQLKCEQMIDSGLGESTFYPSPDIPHDTIIPNVQNVDQISLEPFRAMTPYFVYGHEHNNNPDPNISELRVDDNELAVVSEHPIEAEDESKTLSHQTTSNVSHNVYSNDLNESKFQEAKQDSHLKICKEVTQNNQEFIGRSSQPLTNTTVSECLSDSLDKVPNTHSVKLTGLSNSQCQRSREICVSSSENTLSSPESKHPADDPNDNVPIKPQEEESTMSALSSWLQQTFNWVQHKQRGQTHSPTGIEDREPESSIFSETKVTNNDLPAVNMSTLSQNLDREFQSLSHKIDGNIVEDGKTNKNSNILDFRQIDPVSAEVIMISPHIRQKAENSNDFAENDVETVVTSRSTLQNLEVNHTGENNTTLKEELDGSHEINSTDDSTTTFQDNYNVVNSISHQAQDSERRGFLLSSLSSAIAFLNFVTGYVPRHAYWFYLANFETRERMLQLMAERNFRIAIRWRRIQNDLRNPIYVAAIFIGLTTASPHLSQWPILVSYIVRATDLHLFTPPFWVDRPILFYLGRLFEWLTPQAVASYNRAAITSYPALPWKIISPVD